MKSFWKRKQHEKARLLERFKLLRVKKQQFGRIFGKKEFLDLEHFGKQHDRTFPLLSSPTFPLLSGSFNAFFLLDIKFGWRCAQVGFSVSILGAEVTIRRKRRRWARVFSLQARGSTQPMIRDGTELKNFIPAWGA